MQTEMKINQSIRSVFEGLAFFREMPSSQERRASKPPLLIQQGDQAGSTSLPQGERKFPQRLIIPANSFGARSTFTVEG